MSPSPAGACAISMRAVGMVAVDELCVKAPPPARARSPRCKLAGAPLRRPHVLLTTRSGACAGVCAGVCAAFLFSALMHSTMPPGGSGGPPFERQRVALFTANFDYTLDGVALTLNRLVAHLLDEGHDVAVFAPTRERVPPTVAASFPLRARARAAAAQLERAECEAQQPRAGARTSVRAQLWALASWVAAGGAGVSRRPAGRFVQVRARSVRCPIFKEYELTLPSLGAEVRGALAAFRPTVLHIATPDPLGHAAQRWASASGVAVVCSFHTRYHRYLDFYPFYPGLGALRHAYWHRLRQFHAGCALTLPPSEAVAAELRAHGLARVHLWSRGVDTARFNPAHGCAATRDDWLAEGAALRAAHGDADGGGGGGDGGAEAAARPGRQGEQLRGVRLALARLAAQLRIGRSRLARRLSAARRLWRRAAPPRTASEAAAPASTRAAAPPALRPAAAARLPVLLLVSRLRWEKGLDGFARVVRSLEKARVPHLAVVVGAGSAREALRRRLPRAVFTGALAGAELARAYASADVFLTASTTEGWGGTALEALASGLPVAAFDASGISQLVEPGRSGLLAPADDVPALARHAATLLSLPADERARYRAAARARAADFAWEVELRRMEGYYAHATATAPRRR